MNTIETIKQMADSFEEVLAYCKEHGHDWMCMAEAVGKIQAGRALLEELKGQEPQPMLYVKDINGNFHEYIKEKGHTENCAALGDDCCLENHLPPSRVGVGEDDYTSATQEPVATVADLYPYRRRSCGLSEDTNLYTHPQPAQPKVWDAEGYDALCQQLELVTAERDALKAAQPKEPLTDEQIMAIGKELGLKCRLGGNQNIDFDYARAIEAAHGIGKGEA